MQCELASVQRQKVLKTAVVSTAATSFLPYQNHRMNCNFCPKLKARHSPILEGKHTANPH